MFVFEYGCMYSGKSADMLERAWTERARGKEVVVLKPTVDTRDGVICHLQKGLATSRCDIEPLECVFCDIGRFSETGAEIRRSGVNTVFVDEAQFLLCKDVRFLSELSWKYGLDVYCYGLRTDANGWLFTGSEALFAYADEIIECGSKCACGGKATCHIRIGGGSGSVEIESGDVKYEAVCRQCFEEYKNGEKAKR